MDTPLEPAQTSSPQTPSSVPPIRYFDMLPPELLQAIFDHLIPADLTVATYHERREAVPSLCLVSKRFYQLARPALANALWLINPHLTLIPHEKLEIWKNCRWLKLAMWDNHDSAVLEELVRGTRLDDVAFAGLSSIVPLVLTSNLIKLHLSNVRLPLSFRFVSPTLKQLSLRDVEFSNQANLVHDLPSLRHLGYSLRFRLMGNNHREFISSLVPQLQTISRPLADNTEWESAQSQSGRLSILSYESVLRASHFFPQQGANVEHLRITAGREFGVIGNDEEQSASASLRYWTSVLSSPRSSLTTLYIPSYVSTSNRSLTNLMRGAVDALEATCRLHKVEINYEDLVSDHALDSHISQEFVRRVERGPRRS